MIEVLHVCPSRSFSGLEQYALELAEYQAAHGTSVAFVVCPRSTLEEECQKSNIPTVPFLYDAWTGKLSFWIRLHNLLKKNPQLKAIHLHLSDEVADLSVPLFLSRLTLKNRPKVIFQAHIWISHNKKDIYHKLIYSNVDEVWCSSEAAKSALSQSLPKAQDKIKIVNYGRDVQKILSDMLPQDQARSALKLDGHFITLGTVSRIEKGKGIQEFVEAAVPLLQKNESLRLVVIGGPSPNNTEAKKYFETLEKYVGYLPEGLRPRIRFLGPVAQSYKYLKAFDLYVLPSYLECFSLSLLDAQLAGLPVVGSQSGGTPEVVKENQTGWLFNPEDVLSLRKAMEKALSQQSQWLSFGERAKKRVMENFEQKEIFKKISHAYSEELHV